MSPQGSCRNIFGIWSAWPLIQVCLYQCPKSLYFMRSRSDFTRACVIHPPRACEGPLEGFIQHNGVQCNVLAVIVFPSVTSSPKF